MITGKADPGRRVLTAAALLALACLGGCTWWHEDVGKADLGVAPGANPVSASAAYRETIGALTYYEGLGEMRVRGYGLVVGLGTNGSRDCPKDIYTQLVQRMYKQQHPAGSQVGEKTTTPEELISGLDTAVVMVYGAIPPAAVAGSQFDVGVRAVPGTQTKSLRGGTLLATDLEIFRRVSGRGTVSGKILAQAEGPLFLNPFSDDESATKSNPLEGIVVGGARALKDRRIRLVLVQPSYQWAQRIQGRINSKFSGRERIADATSPSFVQLRIPPEFAEDPGHFLALLRHLYLSSSPQFEGLRAQKLAQEIVQPTAPHADIALCFEGLGRTALPVLKDLYAHPKGYVSFYAGVAGLRLGDHLGGDAVAEHARNPRSEYRFKAILALGEAKGMGGLGGVLRTLLGDEDPRVQVAAYEALVKRDDATIRSTRVGEDGFVIDLVPTAGSALVYAKRSGSRRIALFGQRVHCVPPVFYVAPDGQVTISAQEGDEGLTLIRHVPSAGVMSPPIPASFDVEDLIKLMGSDARVGRDEEVLGLGLDYTAVVRAVYQLCADRSVNARFILEQPNVVELFGAPRSTGRPESDL